MSSELVENVLLSVYSLRLAVLYDVALVQCLDSKQLLSSLLLRQIDCPESAFSNRLYKLIVLN